MSDRQLSFLDGVEGEPNEVDDEAQHIERICARPELIVYGAKGARQYRGVPAREWEWRLLPDGTRVVLVDSEGHPQEHFVVERRPGRVSQKKGERKAFEEPLI